MKKMFHITSSDIWNFIKENPNYYFSVRESSYIGSGYFIEHDTFQQFLAALDAETDTI